MASVFTHAFVAVAAGKAVAMKPMPFRFWTASVLCSVIPDADALGFFLGIPYEHVLGHRGLSHSLLFAALLGCAAVRIVFHEEACGSKRWCLWWAYFFAVTASHGVLDAMTHAGLGVAFFLPADPTRYFLPWRPIEASPIGVTAFFSLWGARVMISEMVYIWAPIMFLFLAVKGIREVLCRG